MIEKITNILLSAKHPVGMYYLDLTEVILTTYGYAPRTSYSQDSCESVSVEVCKLLARNCKGVKPDYDMSLSIAKQVVSLLDMYSLGDV